MTDQQLEELVSALDLIRRRPKDCYEHRMWIGKAWEAIKARPEGGRIIIRTNADATLDEAFVFDGKAHFHLEQMSATHWWMALELDKQRIDINLHSKATIKANVSDEGEVKLIDDANAFPNPL